MAIENVFLHSECGIEEENMKIAKANCGKPGCFNENLSTGLFVETGVFFLISFGFSFCTQFCTTVWK